MPEGGAFGPLSAIPIARMIALRFAAFTHYIKSSKTWRRCTPSMRGIRFWDKLAQRLQVWSTGIDRHDLARLETRCSGARGFCSWSRKQHQSCIGNHLYSLPPSLPHAFAHVVGSNAHARLFYSYNPPALPITSDATRMGCESDGFRSYMRAPRHWKSWEVLSSSTTHRDSWPRRVSFSLDTVYQAIRNCVMCFCCTMARDNGGTTPNVSNFRLQREAGHKQVSRQRRSRSVSRRRSWASPKLERQSPCSQHIFLRSPDPPSL